MKLSALCEIAGIHANIDSKRDIDVSEYVNGRVSAATKEHVEFVQRAFSKGDVSVPVSGGTSFGYGIQPFIADVVCPIIEGSVERKFAKFPRRDKSKVVNVQIGSSGQINETEGNVTFASYVEKSYGLKERIDLNAIASSPIGPDLLDYAASNVMAQLLMAREIRVANLFMTVGNYPATSYSTISGNNQWHVGPATSTADPLKDINITARTALAVVPNTIVASTPVLTYLRQHPKVIAAAGAHASDRVVSLEELARVFSVDKVIEARGKYDSTGNAASPTYGYIWGKSLWIGYVNPSAGRIQQCFAKTVRHTPLTFREEIDRMSGVKGNQWIMGTHEDAELICMDDCGYLLDQVIA